MPDLLLRLLAGKRLPELTDDAVAVRVRARVAARNLVRAPFSGRMVAYAHWELWRSTGIGQGQAFIVSMGETRGIDLDVNGRALYVPPDLVAVYFTVGVNTLPLVPLDPPYPAACEPFVREFGAMQPSYREVVLVPGDRVIFVGTVERARNDPYRAGPSPGLAYAVAVDDNSPTRIIH